MPKVRPPRLNLLKYIRLTTGSPQKGHGSAARAKLLKFGLDGPPQKGHAVCGRSKSAKVRPPGGPNLLKCGSAETHDLFAGDPPSRPTSRKKVMGLWPEQICYKVRGSRGGGANLLKFRAALIICLLAPGAQSPQSSPRGRTAV